MNIIYDMANGVIQPWPEKKSAVDERVEMIPELGVQELPSCGPDNASRSISIHLIRALLNRS